MMREHELNTQIHSINSAKHKFAFLYSLKSITRIV